MQDAWRWRLRLRLRSRCGCADGLPLRAGRLQLFGPDISTFCLFVFKMGVQSRLQYRSLLQFGSRRSRCRRDAAEKNDNALRVVICDANCHAASVCAGRSEESDLELRVRCPKSPFFPPRRPLQVADMPSKRNERPCGSVPTDRCCRAWCNPRYKMPCEGPLPETSGAEPSTGRSCSSPDSESTAAAATWSGRIVLEPTRLAEDAD